MTTRITTLTLVALIWLGPYCQAASDGTSRPASGEVVSQSQQCAPEQIRVAGLEHAPPISADFISAQERSSIANLFRSSPGLYQCPNNNPKCGSACCNSDEQCCLNRSNGTWYCSKKCD